jgi:hypothetical protein
MIIDSKGKLFGKINVIDLLILVVVILAVLFGFMHYTNPEEWTEARVLAKDLELGLADSISIDDFEVSKNGEVIAKVKSVEILPDKTQAILTLDIKVDVKENKLYFKDREVAPNKEIDLNLNSIQLEDSLILANKPELRQKTVTIELYNKKPWLEASIKEVISTTIAVPAEVILTTETGEIYKLEHPTNKDITVTMTIIAEQFGDDFYFNRERLTIGEQILIRTATVDIQGYVSSLN